MKGLESHTLAITPDLRATEKTEPQSDRKPRPVAITHLRMAILRLY
ncbi:hypothetical protein ALP71_02764 [Pseudomonas coronafaciens pv. garcae]|nr:hypothetical protein ALP71_02764 [Pseudomonas coronafaciens pv. garcae]